MTSTTAVEAQDQQTMVRWAGLAGVIFAVSVAASNIWIAVTGIDPAPNAAAAEIIGKFTAHGTSHAVLAGWVAANFAILGVFLAGAHARLRGVAPGWSHLGVIGGALIMAMFALVNVPRVTLAVAGDNLANSPALAEALWRSHLATFGYTGAALGLALLGLSVAAVRAKLVPRWFVIAGPVGAAALITMALLVNAVAAGSPLMFIGVAGFGVWIVFLATFGVRLWLER